MRSKKMKGSKTILSLLLSAALVMEPLGAVSIVHAEENDGTTVQTETELEEKTDEAEEQPDEAGVEEETGENTEKNEESSDIPGDEQTGEEAPKDEEGGALDDPSVDDNGEEEAPDEIRDETPETPSDEEMEDGEDKQQPEDEEESEIDDSEENIPDGEEESSVSENDLDEEEEEEKDETLEGFSELSADYRLNSVQMNSKRELANHLDNIMELDEGRDYAAGEVVLLAESREEAEMIAEAYHAEIKKFSYGVLTLKLNENDTVAKAMRVASNEKVNLPAVWPNYYVYAYGEEAMEDGISTESIVESDDLIEVETTEYELEALGLSDELSYQVASYSDAYLSPKEDYYQYHHTIIGSPYAWEAGYTGSGIEVAVLDTGVNSSHADLPTVTGVGNSATDDMVGHGTHVAGIIAASANGQWGVGVAPDVTLYSGNVLPNNGSGTVDDAMAGVRAVSGQFGADITVDVINMSLGSLGYSEDFQTVITGAYENGVAIFAAAGNDGGNNYNYPACYDHVISIAATDQSNARASFSNYGNKVDLSAPGVDIYSTDAFFGEMINDYEHKEYIDMDGTSMACPVAAGEAAVILSANPVELQGKTGGDKVDALLKLMQDNVVKVSGSGMGKGITNLAKVFDINMTAEKPTAPVIDIVADGESQKVTVTMRAQSRTQIYYTDNGKNPVYKNGAPDDNTRLYTGEIEVDDRIKGEVRAIAVNEGGVCSNVVKKSYTLMPYVRDIAVSGVNQVAKGKSTQLTAMVTPAYAVNKAVTWEIYTTNADKKPDQKIDKTSDRTLKTGVSITNKGKVTAAKTAKVGLYVVKVTAKDEKKDSSGSTVHTPVSKEYEITVTEAVKINSVKFSKKSLTVVIPTSVDLTADDNFVAKQKDGGEAAASEFRWSSNKETVATVNANGVVTPHMAGKAVITALANDSSGKKATCTITVQQLAENLEISGSNVLGKGKSNTYKALLTPANVTNKKVTWSLAEKDGQGQWQTMDSKRARALGVSINASGKLAATSKATPGEYLIKAVTKDAAKIEAEKEVTIKSGLITKITVKPEATTIYRTTNVFGAPTSMTVNVTVAGSNGADFTAYAVTSSDVKGTIATVEESSDNGSSELIVRATGKATGKVTITVKTTDGSNKSAKCTVNVSNSASGLRIAPSGSNNECVAKGKSLQLKAIMETENGTVSNKNVEWLLYTSDDKQITTQTDRVLKTGMKITSKGKVTASKQAKDGEYVVVARAKDGSVAGYSIYVAAPTTKIEVGGLYSGMITLLPAETSGVMRSPIRSDIQQGGLSFSSSNPAVISVGIYYDSGVPCMQFMTGKKGSATITVKALDGSGKQVKYKIELLK